MVRLCPFHSQSNYGRTEWEPFFKFYDLQATEMIDAIRASFKKGLPNLDWMDDKTRRAAEDKVMLIDFKLANVTLGMPISLLIHVTPISV